MPAARATAKYIFGCLLAAAVLIALGWLTADPRTRQLIAITAELVARAAALAVPAGLWLAVVVTRTNLPGRGLLGLLLLLSLLLPLYVYVGAWQAGFGLQGWYTLESGGTELLYGMRGAIWVHAVAAVPWVALIVGAALLLVEPELEEEALLYGPPFRVFRLVTLPRIAGAIGLAFLWLTVSIAGEMTVTDLLRVRTYAEEVYVAYAATGDMEAATLQLLPGVLVLTALVCLGGMICLRLMPSVRPVSLRHPRRWDLGRWRWPAAGLTACLVAILFGVPLISLAYKAGLETITSPRGPVGQQWSAAKALEMVLVESYRQFGDEIRASMVVGSISATLAVALGLLLGWWGRRPGWRAWVVLLLTAFLLAVPGPLLGSWILRLLVRWPTVYDSAAAPCTAIVLRVLPLATLILLHAMRSIPDDLVDLARLDGAGWWRQLWHIALPLRRPAIGVAWLLVFLLAIGDLSASQVLLVPGQETLANRIFDRLHSGAYDQVSGLLLNLLLFFSAVVVLMARIGRRWRAGLVEEQGRGML